MSELYPPSHPDWELDHSAIDVLLQYVPAGSTVVELGSGDGSLRLAEHWTVYSVEDDKRFVGRHEHPNLHYIHAPMVPVKNKHWPTCWEWYDPEVLNADLPSQYDALIVDGPRGGKRRPGIAVFQRLFNARVWLLDDLHRSIEKKVAEHIAKQLKAPLRLHKTHNKVFGVCVRP